MKLNLILFFSLLLPELAFSQTYFMTVDDFEQQFAGMDSSKMIDVKTKGAFGEVFSYKANPIRGIHCTDKNNKRAFLIISPSIQIRFISIDNKKYTFYFDTVSVNDSIITGGESRYLPHIRKPLRLGSVAKIELQDDKKGLQYIFYPGTELNQDNKR